MKPVAFLLISLLNPPRTETATIITATLRATAAQAILPVVALSFPPVDLRSPEAMKRLQSVNFFLIFAPH